MKRPYLDYHMWWKRASATRWTMSCQCIKARTDVEAQSKLRRCFKHAGFHDMSIVAVVSGKNPNDYTKDQPCDAK